MSDGFRVDIESLKSAGLGLAEMMSDLADAPVGRIECAANAVGHHALSSSVDGFCDRWQQGMNYLVGDGHQLSRNLIDCAGTYLEADQNVAFSLGGTMADILDSHPGKPPPAPATIQLPRSAPAAPAASPVELGQTQDPRALIPGDAGAVTTTASSLKGYGQLLAETGGGLKDLDSGGWEGQAADAFRDYFHGQPQRWLQGGDAFTSAAGALEQFTHTLTWAQGQAADAIRLWAQGQAATQQAQAQAASQANQAAATVSANAAPLQDPGEGLRNQAQELLARARSQLDDAGASAARTVSEASEPAPQGPSLLQQIADEIKQIPGNLLHYDLDEIANGVGIAGGLVGSGIQGAGWLAGKVVDGEGTVLGGALHALGLNQAADGVEHDNSTVAQEIASSTHSAGDDIQQWTHSQVNGIEKTGDDIASRLGVRNPSVPDNGVGPPGEHYVVIDPQRFPKASLHILQAQEGTSFHGDESTAYHKVQPLNLTYDNNRDHADARREQALQGIPPRGKQGLDRDEYPPATFVQGGQGSSVKYMPSLDNQGAGGSMGAQLKNLPDASHVRIVVG